MLVRNLEAGDSYLQTVWQELGNGAPTVIGFANLCSLAMARPVPSIEDLTDEAKAILAVAVKRGLMDIRSTRESFCSAERLLAICVEVDEDRRLHFMQRDSPEQTIRFLNGFRELCFHGLVMHHLGREFSLSTNGFELGRTLAENDYSALIGFAAEVPH